MPFVAAPNIAEVQFRQTLDSQATMNRIHVNCLTAPTASICQDIATACAIWWTNNVDSLVTNTLALREVYVKSLHVQNGPEATFSSGFPAPGLLTSAPLPSNCAICVSLRSGLTGRSARGRWFWQGLVESQVDGNIVQTGTLTDIDAAMTNLKSAITTLGYVWVIVSYNTNNAPRVGGPVYFDVATVLFTNSIIDSMRSRLPD